MILKTALEALGSYLVPCNSLDAEGIFSCGNDTKLNVVLHNRPLDHVP